MNICIVVAGKVSRFPASLFLSNRERHEILRKFPRHWVEC